MSSVNLNVNLKGSSWWSEQVNKGGFHKIKKLLKYMYARENINIIKCIDPILEKEVSVKLFVVSKYYLSYFKYGFSMIYEYFSE